MFEKVHSAVAVFAVVLLMAVFVVIGFLIVAMLKEDMAAHVNEAREEGRKAGTAVPSNANPYVYTAERKAWLDGWIETNKTEELNR